MLERLDQSPPEAILQISQDYAADNRAGKIDLGVGVFRDNHGNTPVLDCVKRAEQRIVEEQQTKTYAGLLGNVAFNKAVSALIFGNDPDESEVAAVQTPGGSGALRLLFDLVKLANPDAVVWLPDPTWANHLPVLTRVGLTVKTYPYYNRETNVVDFDAMHACLSKRGPGDVVLLHGCCHNPTGASLSPQQWDVVAKLIAERGFTPLVDLAYQGFGDGLEQDAYGVRRVREAADELLVAYSCSKNFGIYRERTGLAISISKDLSNVPRALGQMKNLARTNHSMPPDHGAEVVRTILCDAELSAAWRGELEEMRKRVQVLRQRLVSAFRDQTDSDAYDYIGAQQGMFSLLRSTQEDIMRLRSDHAVYMVPDGRMNIAGLTAEQVPAFVQAVSRACRTPSPKP